MENVSTKRERVNLCKNHAIKLLFLHTSFGWRRYMTDNTPILGWFTACDGDTVTVSAESSTAVSVTACDYVKPGAPCPEPATDLFVKTWA